MAKLDEQLYLTETENGENDYFKVSSNGKKSTFGVYPIREVKHHMGTYKTYDKDRGLLAFGPFNFSYLALYKKEGDIYLHYVRQSFHPTDQLPGHAPE